MVSWVKCLSHKHGGPGFGISGLHKKLGMEAHASNSSTMELETEGFWPSWPEGLPGQPF